MNKHRVVILGGGFAGLRVALELEKRCARIGQCEILLIDRHSEHLYTPLLYEVATGFLEEPGSVCRGELRQGICIRFEQFRTIVGSKHIHVRRAEVSGADADKKIVTLGTGETVAYDDLVIALGSEAAYYDIPGLREHAFVFKTLHDGFAIRERLHVYLDKYRQGKIDHLRLFIGGAGATGVELACEAANFFGVLQKKRVIRPESWSVTLVDAAPKVLMAFPDDLRHLAERRLRQLGVRVHTGVKLKEAKAGAVTLEMDGQSKEETAEVIVWCGGIQPASVLEMIDLPKGPKGHLDVDPMFCLRGLQNIYALGDCAQFAVGDQFAPALAQVALAQAKVLAENLVCHVERRPLTAWHPPTVWPAVLPMGGAYAIGKVGGICFSGKVGYVIRKIVDLRYWLQTLPLKEAFQVWTRGAKTYLKND